jgi:hypothetical protein
MKIATQATVSIVGLNPNDLHKLEPKDLRNVFESMDKSTEATFIKRFNEEWKSLDPETRRRMLGGTSGAVIAGSATVAALSVRQISQLISHRPLFVLAMTVLGTGVGAFAPDALENFKSGKFDWESPTWWRLIFGSAKVTGNFTKKTAKAGSKSPKQLKSLPHQT